MKFLTISFLTFNRKKYLDTNLKRLINEIKKNKLEDKIHIFIGKDKLWHPLF